LYMEEKTQKKINIKNRRHKNIMKLWMLRYI
jgi:hypothetical protein